MHSNCDPSRTQSPIQRLREQVSTRGLLLALLCLLTVQGAFASDKVMRVQTVAQGLEHPWALAFIDEQRFLVTERPGRMRLVHADGRIEAPLQGLPRIDAGGQGGLLDLVIDPQFSRNRQLYFCYTEPGERGSNGTALARARLSADLRSLERVQVLFRQWPKMAGRLHFGCRIAIDAQGFLFLALGERFSAMTQAQQLDNHLGKIVRLNRDGSVPADNPFVNRPGARPEIWSLGHRNPQGAAIAPDGSLWVHEHGPQGGDEVNRIERGRNYGWPVITYGEQYGGGKIGQGLQKMEGMEQPLHQWTPSIAPSGMAFIQGERYGAQARGHLIVGALRGNRVHRLVWEGPRLLREDIIEAPIGQRVRDVRQGPDGWLYLLTDASDGRLLRLIPAP